MFNKRKGENTRNQENILYRALTRLFSGPITKRRRQFYRRERRIDMQKYDFKSASGAPFKKIQKDMWLHQSAKLVYEQQRAERYADFDMMIYEPILGSALDIYATEITSCNELEKMLKIDCRNQEIKSILDEFYYNVLNIEANLFHWTRTMCKYGDFFLYLDIDEDRGITHVIGLPSREVERLEGEDKDNPHYVQFQWNSGGLTLEDWQICHFRILGDDRFAPYGQSVFEPARRIFRQYDLLKNAMMSYRIVRSPERRVFYLDVGNIPPEEVEQYVLQFQKELKGSKIVDPDSGQVDLRYNPLSVEDDYIIPVRGQSNTRIDSLAGGQYTGDVDDVKFLRDEMMAAIKIPASYIIPEGGAVEDKTSLAQKDILFSKTIQMIQRSVVNELEKMGIIHLYTLGFRKDDLISFKLSLANPSKLAAIQELEHWRTKFDVASAATEGYFSKRWVAVNFFGLSEEEFIRNQREIINDKKYELEIDKIAQALEQESMTGGGGMFGSEAGGPLSPGFGEEQITVSPPGSDLESAFGGGFEGGVGDDVDDTLLASPEEPAKRDEPHKVNVNKAGFKMTYKDGQTTTTKSKGKLYTPKKESEKRSGIQQNLKSMAKIDSIRPVGSQRDPDKNKKKNHPSIPGRSELGSFSKGIMEDFSKEEKQIADINNGLYEIVEKLDKKFKAKKDD